MTVYIVSEETSEQMGGYVLAVFADLVKAKEFIARQPDAWRFFVEEFEVYMEEE